VGAPFMVIATQNPIEQAGTYRLPEAQLDRFLMKTSLGYPDFEASVRVIAEAAKRDRSKEIEPVVTSQVVTGMAELADLVHVDESLLGYVIRLAEATRTHPALRLGVSMRGALAYVRCAKTWAASQGRTYVTPDDVKLLAEPIMGHRVLLEAEAQFAGTTVSSVIQEVLASVAPPTGRGS